MKRKKESATARLKAKKIDNFTDLNMGDYVVHRNYGIGQYIGIEQLNVDGVRKDYLKIRFKGRRLFVCADRPAGYGLQAHRQRRSKNKNEQAGRRRMEPYQTEGKKLPLPIWLRNL